MAFDITKAVLPSGFTRNYKVPAGDYLCEVVNVRQLVGGHKGDRFLLDAKVITAAKDSGIQKGYVINYTLCPAEARGGNGLSPAQAQAKEFGKMVAVVAACFGWGRDDSGQVNQQVFDKAVVNVYPKMEDEPISPLAGKLVVVRSNAHINLKGEGTTFNEIRPVSDWRGALPAIIADPPSLPGAAPVKAFPPAGWERHPDETQGVFYFHREEGKVLPEAELRGL